MRTNKQVEYKSRGTDKRDFLDVAFEVKAMSEEDEFFRFEGFAATYGNIDHNADIIQAGAFSESLTRRMPVILWQHKQEEPIGVVESIQDRADGLYIVAKLPKEDTLVSGRVIPQIKVGSIRKMSVGWITLEWDINQEEGIRTITKGELIEISTVTVPMNDEAGIVSFKNRETDDMKKKIEVDDLEFLDGLKDVDPKNLEKALCESKCFSNNAAKKLVNALTRVSREEENDDETELATELKNLHEAIDSNAIRAELSNLTKQFGETN